MTIAPLTTALHGWAAVHYAHATGATLHRAELRHHGGNIEPARVVTQDEARALLQHDQSEDGLISCEATHGERPYRGTGPAEIDWPAIHAAALIVDAERSTDSAVPLGYDGISDAFGGSYFPPHYQNDGLAGVTRILSGAQTIRTAAWEAVHRSNRVEGGRLLAARALRTALALDRLFCALAKIGVYRYEPSQQICGVTGYEPTDTMQVTGLRWLAGDEIERDAPTMGEISTFLAGVPGQ